MDDMRFAQVRTHFCAKQEQVLVRPSLSLPQGPAAETKQLYLSELSSEGSIRKNTSMLSCITRTTGSTRHGSLGDTWVGGRALIYSPRVSKKRYGKRHTSCSTPVRVQP